MPSFSARRAAACDATLQRMRFRAGSVLPSDVGIVHRAEVAARDVDPRVGVVLARLDQQYTMLRIFRQPVGQHAARGAAADDDIVILVHDQLNTVWMVVNSLRPSAPNSTPKPDCLKPPNGVKTSPSE